MIRHYALMNLGRDKSEAKKTTKIDLDALRECLDLVGDEQAAIFGVEFNEGDDNNEYAAARKVLKDWHFYIGEPGNRVREPIFLSPDQPPARWHVNWVIGTAVPHWSPPRSVLKVHLADVPDSFVTCHNAAGPHTPQPRPKRYQEPLELSWNRSNAARRATKRALHRKGRNVTELSDLNHPDIPVQDGDFMIFHHRTDYGFAWPADGYTPRFHEGQSGHIGLDSHWIRTMHGTYKKLGR